MYDPSIGRFLSEDLLGFEAGDENLYRYVKNRPTVFSDPSGLQQQNPLPVDEWYVAVQRDYRASVRNVNSVLEQIDDLLDNPAGYYNNDGAIPASGVSTLSLNLATNLALMQASANSWHNAGVAVFVRDLRNGAGIGLLQIETMIVKDDLRQIIRDHNTIFERIERQIRDVDNVSESLSSLNSFDGALLGIGNPLRVQLGLVGSFRDLWQNSILPSIDIISSLLLPIVNNFNALQQTCELDPQL